jgi:hypothetical protein
MSGETWGPAAMENIQAVTIGGETFVRHDHNAYAMGYSACKDDARRLVTDMLADWFTRGYDLPGEDMKGGELIDAINDLPPKEGDDE